MFRLSFETGHEGVTCIVNERGGVDFTPVCISFIWTSNPHQDKVSNNCLALPVLNLLVKKMGLVKIFLLLLNAFLTLYDLVTFPIYWLLMPSWKERTKQNLGEVLMTEMTSKTVTVTRKKGQSPIYQEVIIEGKVDTAIKAFDFAVNKYKQAKCLGSRQVLKEQSEVQNDGKVTKKVHLSDYKWVTYEEVQDKAMNFGKGLRSVGLQSGCGVAIYAETRAEWMISCLGAFTQVSLK